MIKRIALLLLLLPGFAGAATYIGKAAVGETSYIANFRLIDEDGLGCPTTDIAGTESGLEVWVRADNESSVTKLTAAGTDLDAATNPHVYQTPTAGEARFGVVDAGGCVYYLMLENTRLNVTGANRLNITVMDTDGSAKFLEDAFWIDQSVVAADDLVDLIHDEEVVTGHNTANTAGAQIGALMDTINTAVATTLNNKLDAVIDDTDEIHQVEAGIDVVNSQTSLDASAGPATDDDLIGQSICVEDATDKSRLCSPITDYVAASSTFIFDSGNITFTITTDDKIIVPYASGGGSGGGLSEAQVNAQVDLALTDINLDHLMAVAVTGPDVVDNSALAKLTSSSGTADWDSFVNTTDSLQAMADAMLTAAEVNAEADQALVDINLDHFMAAAVTGANVVDNSALAKLVSKSATADWDSFVNTSDSMQAIADAFATLNDLSAAQVNAEVLDVLATDTFAQPGSVLSATATIKDSIIWLATWQRNKMTQTNITTVLRNDADNANITTCAVSDDGVKFTRDECL